MGVPPIVVLYRYKRMLLSVSVFTLTVFEMGVGEGGIPWLCPVVGTWPFAWGPRFDPGWGTKLPQATRCSHKREKKKW